MKDFIEGAVIIATIWGLTVFAVYQWSEQATKAVM